MNNMTIHEDVNGENNMTSEFEDFPQHHRALSQNRLLMGYSERGQGQGPLPKEEDFENTYSPHGIYNSQNSSLLMKKTGTSNNNLKKVSSEVLA
jgi:hypothetical protein